MSVFQLPKDEDIHWEWIPIIKSVAKCDLCQQRNPGIMQACCICKVTFCQACRSERLECLKATTSRLEVGRDPKTISEKQKVWLRSALDAKHAMDPDTVNWTAYASETGPAPKRARTSTAKGGGEGGKNGRSQPGGRRSSWQSQASQSSVRDTLSTPSNPDYTDPPKKRDTSFLDSPEVQDCITVQVPHPSPTGHGQYESVTRFIDPKLTMPSHTVTPYQSQSRTCTEQHRTVLNSREPEDIS